MRSVGEYMREQKERKELLLFNYGIEGLVELGYQSDKKESMIDEDPSLEKEYPPYIVNRCFSGHLDAVLFANEINQYHFLLKKCNMTFC